MGFIWAVFAFRVIAIIKTLYVLFASLIIFILFLFDLIKSTTFICIAVYWSPSRRPLWQDLASLCHIMTAEPEMKDTRGNVIKYALITRFTVPCRIYEKFKKTLRCYSRTDSAKALKQTANRNCYVLLFHEILNEQYWVNCMRFIIMNTNKLIYPTIKRKNH